MKSVFIGGSRQLSSVNAEVARRLDNIVQQNLRVLIGDANGFDRAAQKYLADQGYRAVLVFCTNGRCRNNIGEWPQQTVEFHGRERGRAFYTAKDDAMLNEADYGLFAWDGKSQGTLRNILMMAQGGKPSAVYLSSTKRFVSVRNANDASGLKGDLPATTPQGDQLFSTLLAEETSVPVVDRCDVPTTVSLPRL